MGAPPEPRVGTTSRRQRAGEIPHPHRRRTLVRGRQLGYAVYVLIEQYGSPFVFPARREARRYRGRGCFWCVCGYPSLWVANYYSSPQSVEIIKFGDPGSGR